MPDTSYSLGSRFIPCSTGTIMKTQVITIPRVPQGRVQLGFEAVGIVMIECVIAGRVIPAFTNPGLSGRQLQAPPWFECAALQSRRARVRPFPWVLPGSTARKADMKHCRESLTAQRTSLAFPTHLLPPSSAHCGADFAT